MSAGRAPRVRFDRGVDEPHELSWATSCVVDRVNFELKASFDNDPIGWSFARYSRRGLASEIFELFPWMLQSGHYFGTHASALRYRLSIGGLLSKIDSIDPAARIQSLRDMDRAFLETLDHPGLLTSEWARLGHIVKMLRAARAKHSASVASDLKCPELGDRLRFVSRHPKPASIPRDAYSPFVANQIEGAVKPEIALCITRVRNGQSSLRELQERSVTPAAPNEAILLELSMAGHMSPATWEAILRRHSFRRQTARRRVVMSDFQLGNLHDAARLLAAGSTHDAIEQQFGWSPKTVAGLLGSCPDFLPILEQAEGEWLEQIRSHLLDTSLAEEKTRLQCLAAVASQLPNDASRTETELDRRLRILQIWAERGVPRAKLGSVNFTWPGIVKWQDEDYRFACLGDERPIALAHPVLKQRIATVLQSLSDSYGSRFSEHNYAPYLRKIDVLENWFLTDPSSESISKLQFHQAFFVAWSDAALGVQSLPYVQSCSGPRRYRSLTKWGVTLLRALEVEQRRGTQKLSADRVSCAEIKLPAEIALSVCPSGDELTALLCRLALLTQIDIGSLKQLKRDCLINEAHGFVDVRYRKARDSKKLHLERVRDGSLETAGGLIRVILELTEVASRALREQGSPHADQLWLAAEGNGFKKYRFRGAHPRNPFSRLCARHDIRDNNGDRLDRIQPSRFRKTVKNNKYRKSGDLFAIADDHSPAVSRDHYADLPSLAAVHDETVERGLRNAITQVTERVIDNGQTPEAEARRLSRVTGVDERTCLDVINGQEDTWLAGCLGFRSSPYADEGDACPVSFTECIHCDNSVFTVRKLPNLLRYLYILEDRRRVVAPDQWAMLYLDDYDRLTKQILPRFTADQREVAEGIVNADAGEDPLFIPTSSLRAM